MQRSSRSQRIGSALLCLASLSSGCAGTSSASECSGALCDEVSTATDAATPRSREPSDAAIAKPPAQADGPCVAIEEGWSCPIDASVTKPESEPARAPTPEPADEAMPGEDGMTCYRIVARAADGKSELPVGVALDAYYMIVVEPPWKQSLYAKIIRPIIDNEKVLHHWLLYQDNIPTPPTPPVLQIGAHPTGQLLAGWAPGADTIDFREDDADVSIELPSTTSYTLELHYNSSDLAARDASGVEICGYHEKTKHVAGISWLGFDQLVVPSAKWTGTCAPLSLVPIHITHVWPHMHMKGTRMKATIQRLDGRREVLHDEPFDFNYQRAYKKDVTLMPGETITTECTYAQPMAFGQPTYMEMCYLFTTAYPKGALQGLDLWGTVAHGTSSCLGM